jgi:hypothetical protein
MGSNDAPVACSHRFPIKEFLMTGDKPMSDFEEQTFTALKNLFEKVETLRQMDIREMLEPEKYYLTL